jgi:hypothetical protein
VSAKKSAPKRPYSSPALTKLTPEEALALLDAKSIPGDKQAKKLRAAITSRLEKRDKRTK